MSQTDVLETEKPDKAKRKYRMYGDSEKAATLAALKANGGNILRTSRDTGIACKTIRYWRNGQLSLPKQAEVQALAPLAEANLDRKLHSIGHRMADGILERPLAEESIRDMAVVMGISIQRRQELLGNPTVIVEHRHTHTLAAYTPDQLRELRAALTGGTVVDALPLPMSGCDQVSDSPLSLPGENRVQSGAELVHADVKSGGYEASRGESGLTAPRTERVE